MVAFERLLNFNCFGASYDTFTYVLSILLFL